MAITGGWERALKAEFGKPYYSELYKKVKEEYSTHLVFPPSDEIFRAFELTPLEDVKVLILGQDPYHDNGQANGLCFSVRDGIRIPPSLANIFKELRDDIGCDIPVSGDLTKWAKEGVLLLNSVLTVRAHSANSHRGIGWETFTDAAVRVLTEQDRPLVFILWGASARQKKALIHDPRHLVIESVHPSPLSAHAGFFGTRPFTRCNEHLVSMGVTPVDWDLTKA